MALTPFPTEIVNNRGINPKGERSEPLDVLYTLNPVV